MMTDEGCGNGTVGGLLVMADVKKAKDSFRCASVKFSVVSLTFGSEAGISAIRCLGSGFSDLQFWFLFWSAL